jgi:hypothetical protein
MIRYRIEPSPFEPGRWILYYGTAIFGGTWRECAEKLRFLHPKAKLMVVR